MKDELRRPMMLLVKAAIEKNRKTAQASESFSNKKPSFGGLSSHMIDVIKMITSIQTSL